MLGTWALRFSCLAYVLLPNGLGPWQTESIRTKEVKLISKHVTSTAQGKQSLRVAWKKEPAEIQALGYYH